MLAIGLHEEEVGDFGVSRMALLENSIRVTLDRLEDEESLGGKSRIEVGMEWHRMLYTTVLARCTTENI